MRKIIILFSFFLFSIHFSNAQVCDKINCDNVKNYINIKIIEETVKIYPEGKALEEYFKKNTIETPLNYSEFVNILNSNNLSQTREKLGDVINSLKIKTDYTKDEFASRLMDEIASKLNEKQKKASNFETLKVKLINEINTYLNDKITDPVTDNNSRTYQDTNDYEEGQIAENQNAETEKPGFFSFSNLNLFTLLSLLIPILLFIILWARVNELFKKNERRKEEIKNKQDLTNSSQRESNSSQISKSEFETLLSNSRIFNDFHSAIENLQKQTVFNPQQSTVSTNQSTHQAPIPSTNSSDIFFMKYPVENSFSNNHKSLTKENTIYKFLLKGNKTEAEFEIHTEGVKIDEIISMVERTIKTGCDEDNNPSNNTRNIKTLNKGIVSLEGDKWVIKRKAIIRYE
jgi:hemoglobin-like flavoprotein